MRRGSKKVDPELSATRRAAGAEGHKARISKLKAQAKELRTYGLIPGVDAAEKLAVAYSTVLRWTKEGKVKHVLFGPSKRLCLDLEDLAKHVGEFTAREAGLLALLKERTKRWRW